MVLSDDVVGHFDVCNEDVLVFDIDAELFLQSFMDMDASLNINESSFISPVSFEGNGHSLAY